MQRILVIGTTGSGKSTVAQKLGKKLDLIYTDLDDFHWLPGWVERPREDFRRLAAEVVDGEKWVLAGNYVSRAQDVTWPHADTVIWLDMPFWANFGRLFKRTCRRACSGEIICNGNKEFLGRQFFSKDSILLWFLRTWHSNRKRYTRIFANPAAYPHLRFIRLRSYQESREFLDKLA